MNSTVDLTTATLLRVVVMVVVIDGEVRGKMQFVSQSVRLSLRFCDIISNHWLSALRSLKGLSHPLDVYYVIDVRNFLTSTTPFGGHKDAPILDKVRATSTKVVRHDQ